MMACRNSCRELDQIDNRDLTGQILIERDVYTQHDLDSAYGYVDRSKSSTTEEIVGECRGAIRRNCRCSKRSVRAFLLGHFPFLDWGRKYSLRRDLIYDIIGGLTVGVMHIPQGMAYGVLAGLDQVNGLYTSFFASLVYVFFGTSRHVSIGTFAVISIMMGSLRDRLIPPNTNSTVAIFSNTTAPPDFPEAVTPVELATATTVLVGIILLCMFVLRLGFLTSYLSDALISGFTTGAAVHVLFTQFPPLLGVEKPKCDEIGKLICSTLHLARVITRTNPITLAVSIVCLVLVWVMKDYLSPALKRRTSLPLPGELIAIVLGTLVSYFGRLAENFNVNVVGPMPTGLPLPVVPRIDLAPWIVGDCLSIAIVIFSVTVSVAKIFAKKHRYRIDPNQELLALGLVQCFCSFFGCFPPSGSLGRSTLFESTGTRTQIAAIIGCGVVLVVLLWLGPLFYALPSCILAAIIVVALKGMLLQFKELPTLLRISKIDAIIWICSFLAVVCLGVTYGLAVGVLVGMFSLILRLQWPESTLLTWLPGTELYRNQDCYTEGQSLYGVKIFRFDAPLNFANAERFKSALFAVCRVDLERARKYLRTCAAFPPSPPRVNTNNHHHGHHRDHRPLATVVHEHPGLQACSTPIDENGNNDAAVLPATDRGGHCEDTNTTAAAVEPSTSQDTTVAAVADADAALDRSPTSLNSTTETHLEAQYIVIDCSAFGYVDTMGLEALKQIYRDLSDINVRVLYAACRASLRRMFDSSNFHATVPAACIFVSVHDAVMVATGGQMVGLRMDSPCFSS